MSEAVLPWPPKVLNPNERPHHMAKSRAVKAYRAACGWACKAAKLTAPEDGDIHIWIDFYQPDKRHRDEDNMLAAAKSLLDGLADALQVNDKRFKLHPFFSEQIGGYIKVRITGGPTP